MTVKAIGAKKTLLVIGRIVAYLTTSYACLPAYTPTYGVPALLVEAIGGTNLVALVHKRVIKKAKTQ